MTRRVQGRNHDPLWWTCSASDRYAAAVAAAVAQERRVTPHLEILREGLDGTDVFASLLVDDPDSDGGAPLVAQGGDGAQSVSAPTGLSAFLQHLKAEVVAELQEEAHR